MLLDFIRSLRKELKASRCAEAARPRAQLLLELLEDRCVPATAPAGLATPDYVIAQRGLASPDAASGPVGLTPSQLRNAYGFNAVDFGGIAGDGAGQTIAIIDAYDNPMFVSSTNAGFLSSDLHRFDVAFGLADPPSFLKVNQTGGSTMPKGDTGWGGEIALDVEWVHALAPKANILLVEANSAGYADLMAAIGYAKSVAGVSVVSMSFGGGEFSGESSYDSVFTTPAGHPGVTFVASTGDNGRPAGYPAHSTHVLAVGGTTLALGAGGVYGGEVGWNGSGGGVSSYEAKPAYQNSVTLSATRRTAPDVAFDADPASGVAVFDSYANGSAAPWEQIGGTSLSSPAWAALIAIADQGRAAAGLGALDGFSQTLPMLYSLPGADFHDIVSGSNGYSAGVGYDLVTGRGSPIAPLVARDLASGTAPAQGGPYVVSAVLASSSSIRVTFSEAMNPATFTAADVRLTGPSGAIAVRSVAVVAGSGGTQFDIGFDAQTGPEAIALTVDADIASVAGALLDQNQNGTGGEAADGFGTTLTLGGAGTYSSTDTPQPIQDFTYTVSSIEVPTDLVIAKVTVKINVSHTFDSDLQIWLLAPSGWSVLLANRRGGSGDNFTNTIFDSAASRAIAAGRAPFSGSYRPEQSLAAAYNGYDARGTWSLVVKDVAARDVGMLNSWSLTIQGVSGTGLGPALARQGDSLRGDADLASALGAEARRAEAMLSPRSRPAAEALAASLNDAAWGGQANPSRSPLAAVYQQGLLQHSRPLRQANELLAAFFAEAGDLLSGMG